MFKQIYFQFHKCEILQSKDSSFSKKSIYIYSSILITIFLREYEYTPKTVINGFTYSIVHSRNV